MSRIIKFRAWNKTRDEMLFNVNLPCDFRSESGDGIWMQFTGLLDSKGVEIYESDVLIHHYFNENGTVIWQTAQSRWALEYFADRRTQELFPIDKDSFEVIGNIYSNPELLCQKP